MKMKQQGFSLFIVMVLMIVIAFLVIVTNQSSLTEMRTSSNEADRKLAFGRAENGLRTGEANIQRLVQNGQIVTFTDSCTNGLCLPAAGSFDAAHKKDPFNFSTAANPSTVQAWNRCRTDVKTSCEGRPGETVLDDNAKTISDDGNARYIIEYLGMTETSGVQQEIFRVTAKAKGNNENTQVILQSYVELIRDE